MPEKDILEENEFAINEGAYFVLDAKNSTFSINSDGSVHLELNYNLQDQANLQNGPGVIKNFIRCGVFAEGSTLTLENSQIQTKLLLRIDQSTPKRILLNGDPQSLSLLSDGQKGRQGAPFVQTQKAE